jgi:hypothetical protein
MGLDRWKDVKAAEKTDRPGRVMEADQLITEDALGGLALILEKKPVNQQGLKEKRPALRAYRFDSSPIMTYVGFGRLGDGLRLYPGKGGCPACLENAVLCLRGLERVGYDLEAAAQELGYDSLAALEDTIAQLPRRAALAAEPSAPATKQAKGTKPPAPPSTIEPQKPDGQRKSNKRYFE